MASPLAVIADDLANLEDYFLQAPSVASRALRLAINQSVQRTGMKMARDEIRKQVGFTADYLNDPSRLGVSKLASDTDLEASIKARARATSLARFGTGDMTPNVKRPGGIPVMVKTGKTTVLKKAFPVRLRRGASLTEDNFNLGLAIRLKAGERLANKTTMKQLGKTAKDGSAVYLLYGPSVDQIFRQVAEDISPELANVTAIEFLRQFDRLLP